MNFILKSCKEKKLNWKMSLNLERVTSVRKICKFFRNNMKDIRRQESPIFRLNRINEKN